MSRKRIRYIQLALEASIPLLGFFLWDWSLYFILLFYFLDLLANEMVMHLKAKKVASFQNNQQSAKQWLKRGAFSLLVLISGVALIHSAMLFIAPGIVFQNEAVAFWNYEEMGIKQGYLFVPLVFMLSFQQYRMEFLMPARFRTVQMKELWSTHTRALVVMTGFAGVCLGISLLVELPEIAYVLGIVVISSAYRLKFEK